MGPRAAEQQSRGEEGPQVPALFPKGWPLGPGRAGCVLTAGPPHVEMLPLSLKQVKPCQWDTVTDVFSLETTAWAPPTVHVLDTEVFSVRILGHRPH